MSDEEGREVWWCKTHESRFLEKQPSKYALCLLSLHERNFEAIGWEDCDPVLVRVVPVPVAAARPPSCSTRVRAGRRKGEQ